MVAITVYLAVTAVCLMIAYMKFLFRFKREGEAPYVPGHFLWGNGHDFAKHAVKFLHRSRKMLGDIFIIRLLNQHIVLITDPHALEEFSKEKNFSWEPITHQVNNNVFSVELRESRKMITLAGKKVNGKFLDSSIDTFAKNLGRSIEEMSKCQMDSEMSQKQDLNGNVGLCVDEKGWRQGGLRTVTAQSFFHPLFYTIFGRSRGDVEDISTFNPDVFHSNFDIFHTAFNYLWLGMPISLFPKACESLKVLLQQPTCQSMLGREDVSDYIQTALTFMRDHNHSDSDMAAHNLIFLHVNYNTFRVNYWCVYYLLTYPFARESMMQELREAMETRKEEGEDGQQTVGFNIEDYDKLPLLDSFVKETLRLASGVFVVRKVIADTQYTMPNGKTYLVREGDRVAMYPPATCMDPEIFEDPEEFKFDRFVDAKFYKHGKELKNPLQGFGALCPGKKIALLEIKWYIINFLNSFQMELLPGEKTEFNTACYGHEILPPTHDVQVRFRLNTDAPKILYVPRLSGAP